MDSLELQSGDICGEITCSLLTMTLYTAYDALGLQEMCLNVY